MEQQIFLKDAPLLSFHKKVFFCFILGQIACGYTLSIAGTGLAQATDALHLNSFWVGLLGAGTLIGLMGSLFIGNIVDRVGRKTLFMYDMIAFGILALVQYFINDPVLLFIDRLLLGLTISVDYTTGAALLTEWLPREWGPKAQSCLIIFWTIGFIGSYFTGSAITGFGADNWKFVFMSSAIPALVAGIVRLIIRIPESAEWLATVNRYDEGVELVHKYIGPQYTLPPYEAPESNEKVTLSELFKPENRINALVGGISYGTQVFPYFGVGIFIPIVVKSLNVSNPSLIASAYNILVLAGAVLGVILFDKMPRRAFLIWTFYIAAAGIIGMILLHTVSVTLTIACFLIFALGMAVAVVSENPYPPELFTTRMRASGIGFSIFCSRVAAAAGTFMLPVLMESAGVYVTLGVCAAVLLFGGIFCQRYAPETSPKFGHPIE
jgi:putative MFS transporter